MTAWKDKSDLELMRLYQAEDSTEAFAELYRRHSGKVMGYALKKIQPETLANEAFQETFLKFHRNRDAFDESVPVSAWLFVIARSVLVDVYRRNKKHASQVNIDDIEVPEEVQDLPAIDLSSLSDDERKLVESRFFAGESYKEMSAKVNKSEASLRKRVSRIIEKIRLAQTRGDHD